MHKKARMGRAVEVRVEALFSAAGGEAVSYLVGLGMVSFDMAMPPVGQVVLLHTHDKWMGPGKEDELLLGSLSADGKFYANENNIEVRSSFLRGWAPVKVQGCQAVICCRTDVR